MSQTVQQCGKTVSREKSHSGRHVKWSKFWEGEKVRAAEPHVSGSANNGTCDMFQTSTLHQVLLCRDCVAL